MRDDMEWIYSSFDSMSILRPVLFSSLKVDAAKREPQHEKVVGIHASKQFGPEQLGTTKEKVLYVLFTKTVR